MLLTNISGKTIPLIAQHLLKLTGNGQKPRGRSEQLISASQLTEVDRQRESVFVRQQVLVNVCIGSKGLYWYVSPVCGKKGVVCFVFLACLCVCVNEQCSYFPLTQEAHQVTSALWLCVCVCFQMHHVQSLYYL